MQLRKRLTEHPMNFLQTQTTPLKNELSHMMTIYHDDSWVSGSRSGGGEVDF